MKVSSYNLVTPPEVSRQLADRMRGLRLRRNWKQSTLAERAGVSLPTLRRFEQCGEISLKHLLLVAGALGRLRDFDEVFAAEEVRSMKELEDRETRPKRQRASR